MPFRKFVLLFSNVNVTIPHKRNSTVNQLYHSGAYEIKGVTPSTSVVETLAPSLRCVGCN